MVLWVLWGGEWVALSNRQPTEKGGRAVQTGDGAMAWSTAGQARDTQSEEQAEGRAPSDLLVLAASALFWAWFDSGVFRPTFLVPFAAERQAFLPYLVTAIAAGAAVLLAACLKERGPVSTEQYAREQRRWICAAASALLGTTLSLFGGASEILALIVLGAIGAGASCGFFQLAWGSIYARAGSQSAGRIVALSIALGVLVDVLVMGLGTWFAVIFTAALPLVSAGLALFLLREKALTRTEHDKRDMPAAEDVFGSHRTLCGLPLSLFVAFGLFGLSFGYYQHSAVFLPANAASYSSDALIAVRGVTALIVGALLWLFPRQTYAVFKVGTLVGIAGFIAAPLFGLIETQGIVASAVIAVGYTTFDIATWALMAELVRATGASPTRLVGCGRLAIHMAEVVAVMGCAALASLPNAREAFSSTVGYGCVVAEMLLLADNSALWLLMNSSSAGSVQYLDGRAVSTAVTDAGANAAHAPADVPTMAATYLLTERESEVLTLLLAGHGRARVAQALGISQNTLGTHIQQIYRKMDVHSRQELLDRYGK